MHRAASAMACGGGKDRLDDGLQEKTPKEDALPEDVVDASIAPERATTHEPRIH